MAKAVAKTRSGQRRRKVVCFHCYLPLSTEDGEHYGYECHVCVIQEHDLRRLAAGNPEHPDVIWLDGVPVLVDA